MHRLHFTSQRGHDLAASIAQLILDESERVRAQGREHATEAFGYIAGFHAKRACRRMFHRNGRCAGLDCDGAFVPAFTALNDKIVGHDAASAPSGRSAKSLLVRWFLEASDRSDFETFAKKSISKSYIIESRRAWNAFRGLVQKCNLSIAMENQGVQHYESLLSNEPKLRATAAMLGVDSQQGFVNLATAMFEDACETGLQGCQFDTNRIVRNLTRGAVTPDVISLDEAIQFLEVVDTLIAGVCPTWYDTYLDRPRGHTRPVAALSWHTAA